MLEEVASRRHLSNMLDVIQNLSRDLNQLPPRFIGIFERSKIEEYKITMNDIQSLINEQRANLYEVQSTNE